LALALFAADAWAVTIPTVPVGNPGNANDPATGSLYGGLSYNYRIGTTEVTNAQYVEFLNAKAASDPLGLYNGAMSFWVWGGITQSGVDGSYTYATKTDMGNKPVNFVSWYDSIRFANWLHNGQGSGDTENGAYTLLGGTPLRNPSAKWWLPSEDEWYKAAYHQPASQGGDLDDYWLYPTASNSGPTMATANGAGDIANPGMNVANYNDFSGGSVGNVTTVGSAGPLSASFYGTYDQGGNVWEWNEDLVMPERHLLGLRGGGWEQGGQYMMSYFDGTALSQGEPGQENEYFGFRVATVPEPSTFVLAALGILGMAGLRKGRRSIRSAVALLALALSAADAMAVTIPTVPVGNAGNANDPLSGNLYGGVAYAYRIGTTEVTNAQYAAFLNEKAKSDPLALYNTLMGSEARGGITRTGVSGAFTYTTRANMADKPVNYVSWYDSIRFANWLNNGQGGGSTEHGSYTLGPLNLDGTPANGPSITRNAGATWFLPSENEWYKAAYYQPAAQGGDADDYWLYPTRANTAPSSAAADSVGTISNPGANVANCADFPWHDAVLTTVGSAGPLSQSFYGTSDQGGNVWEMLETPSDEPLHPILTRGGSFDFLSDEMRSTVRLSGQLDLHPLWQEEIGFRVATVPEPSTFALAALSTLGVWAYARRRRSRASGV
jgi:formylglycine-generating enzyme required for sulfatase activity